MVQRQGEFDGKGYTLERYGSIDEFLRVLESRELVGSYSWRSADLREEEYSDKYFHGVKGYTDAREQFVNGTKAKAEMNKAYTAMQTSRKREQVNAICGCVPVVAKAIMGVPNAMIDTRHKRIPKVVRVVVNMSIKGDTSAREITEAGKKIIAAVGKLEAQGISTEILCTADKLLNYHQISSCGIAIKNSGQVFSAARVSFSMSSPAFLRTFQWLQLATNPNAEFDDGYGSNVAYHYSGNKLSDYYRAMYGEGIYISLPDVVRYGAGEIDKAINEWQKRR